MISRLEVIPGAGVVARFGDVVVWAGPGASAALVGFLIDSARNVGHATEGGARIADHVSGVLQGRDPEPGVAFVALGPSRAGTAIVLHGPVQAWDGRAWLVPQPSPGWLRTEVAATQSIAVTAHGAPPPAPAASSDLREGIVPAAGFSLVSGADEAPTTQMPSGTRVGSTGGGEVGDRPQLDALPTVVEGMHPLGAPSPGPAAPSGSGTVTGAGGDPGLPPPVRARTDDQATVVDGDELRDALRRIREQREDGAGTAPAPAGPEPTSVLGPTGEEPTSVLGPTGEEPTSVLGPTGDEPTSAGGTGGEPTSVLGSISDEPTSVLAPGTPDPTSVSGTGGDGGTGTPSISPFPPGRDVHTGPPPIAPDPASPPPPFGPPPGDDDPATPEVGGTGADPELAPPPAPDVLASISPTDPAAPDPPTSDPSALDPEPPPDPEPAVPAGLERVDVGAPGPEPGDPGPPDPGPVEPEPVDPEPPEPGRADPGSRPGAPGVERPGPTATRPAGRSVAAPEGIAALDGPPPLPPLPAVGQPEPPAAGQPVVAGATCPLGHFNHPTAPACIVCGRPIDRTSGQVSGPRPVLGVLLYDDGTVLRLDRSYLLGSDPAADPTVTGGRAHPVALAPDPDLAPVHVEIRLTGWTVSVIDRGAAHPTLLLPPGAASWESLRPYITTPLLPGTHIAAGPRVLTMISPWPIGAPLTGL